MSHSGRNKAIKADALPNVQVIFTLSSKGVERVHFEDGESFSWQILGAGSSSMKKEIDQWMLRYLNKEQGTLPFCQYPILTPFILKVLDAISSIPLGEVRSYSQIAELVGSPKAARAVGSACRRNPFPLLIPCHRVVGSSGKMGGYTPSPTLKKSLLHFESFQLAH